MSTQTSEKRKKSKGRSINRQLGNAGDTDRQKRQRLQRVEPVVSQRHLSRHQISADAKQPRFEVKGRLVRVTATPSVFPCQTPVTRVKKKYSSLKLLRLPGTYDTHTQTHTQKQTHRHRHRHRHRHTQRERERERERERKRGAARLEQLYTTYQTRINKKYGKIIDQTRKQQSRYRAPCAKSKARPRGRRSRDSASAAVTPRRVVSVRHPTSRRLAS
jgi:hypothetical protein